jgi:hypothetical protein
MDVSRTNSGKRSSRLTAGWLVLTVTCEKDYPYTVRKEFKLN